MTITEEGLMANFYQPLDPECPIVSATFGRWNEDPIMRQSGCMEEFAKDFERKHRRECERCKAYGLANIEVEIA